MYEQSALNNCSSPMDDATSYQYDKVYVILAVATATFSFFLNLFQFIVIIHQRLLKQNKNIIIINLCACGQLSSCTVLWYIYKVLTHWQEGETADNYLLCFLLPSGLHLLVIFTFTPLMTLLILQYHLVIRPKTYPRCQNSNFVIVLLVILAWCEAIIISLIPLTGWNDWSDTCSVPFIWAPSFSILMCIIYFLHYPMVIILLTDLCLWSSKKRRSICPEILLEELKGDSLTCGKDAEPRPLCMKSVIVLLVMYMLGTLPFICYTARVALNQDTDLCMSLVANEKAAMWTSWITVVFAAVRPLFHVVVDDDLGDGTAHFFASLCGRKK